MDPVTGAACAGNPFAGQPDPNSRRIIAYGLRNPFRFTTPPGTNELWVGDVGWNTWEEINRIANATGRHRRELRLAVLRGRRTPGAATTRANLTLCETLYAQGAGAVTAPLLTYNHAAKVVTGETCPTGSSSISGIAFYPETGGSFPASYRGGLFFADHNRNCIWFMAKGTNGQPDPGHAPDVRRRRRQPGRPRDRPDGDLYYATSTAGRSDGSARSATQSPTARIVAVPTSGTAPLTRRVRRRDLDRSGGTLP